MRLAAVVLVMLAAVSAEAKTRKKPAPRPKPQSHACLKRLDRLEVPYERAGPRVGIEVPVRVTGPIGGISYRSYGKKPLVLDCSLVYSLAKAGSFFTDQGLASAWFSSAYQIRNVRGTDKPSMHSYGLAIDVHRWRRADGSELIVELNYEQGLGDEVDCVGKPVTVEGRALRTIWCRMDRSGLFRFIISPDEDSDHHNHFHIEARPWGERTDLSVQPEKRAQKP